MQLVLKGTFKMKGERKEKCIEQWQQVLEMLLPILINIMTFTFTGYDFFLLYINKKYSSLHKGLSN